MRSWWCVLVVLIAMGLSCSGGGGGQGEEGSSGAGASEGGGGDASGLLSGTVLGQPFKAVGAALWREGEGARLRVVDRRPSRPLCEDREGLRGYQKGEGRITGKLPWKAGAKVSLGGGEALTFHRFVGGVVRTAQVVEGAVEVIEAPTAPGQRGTVRLKGAHPQGGAVVGVVEVEICD